MRQHIIWLAVLLAILSLYCAYWRFHFSRRDWKWRPSTRKCQAMLPIRWSWSICQAWRVKQKAILFVSRCQRGPRRERVQLKPRHFNCLSKSLLVRWTQYLSKQISINQCRHPRHGLSTHCKGMFQFPPFHFCFHFLMKNVLLITCNRWRLAEVKVTRK